MTARTLNGIMQTFVVDDEEKLTSITQGGSTVKSFSYDTAGRTTGVTVSGNTTTLAYDFEGRVTTITYPNTSTNTFTYNGLDTRVSKVDSGGTKTFLRDGAGVTAPVLADAAAVFTSSISERRSSTTTYYHNGFKNAESQTIANETVSATQTFDAFGLPDTNSGTWKGPFAYGGPYGYQSDSDSGLMLLGHRYYDSSTVRFLSRDPIKHGRNWYGYCGNNPLARVDTTGNVGVAIGIVVVLVVGGIAIYIGSVRGGDSAVDAGSSATTTLPSYAIPSPAGELAGPIGAEGPLLSIGQNRLKHKGAIDDLTGYNGEPNYTGPSDSLDTDENCNKGLYLQDPNPGPNPILTGPPSGRHPTFILKAYNDSAPLGPALPPRPVPPAVGPPASINGGRPGNILYG